ncbi:hypothetical protein TNCV_4642591 [Trichonephila clavipes]|nr:hypothetical protein TNCV_4642591 [Trichonephila clavipes]
MHRSLRTALDRQDNHTGKRSPRAADGLWIGPHNSPREAGWSNRRIGRHPRSERYGSCSVCGNSGSQKIECTVAEGQDVLNTNDARTSIRRAATSAPTTSLASIQRHFTSSRHPVPSRETIRRRLTEVGLRSRRPLRRLPLIPTS